MALQGLRGSNNPKAILSSILSKREKLQEELRSVEKQVYELETSYLQETSTFGNALKGFDGFLSSSKNTAKASMCLKYSYQCRYGYLLMFWHWIHESSWLTYAINLKRSRKFQLEDRIFSLSSVTSPAAEELRAGKEDGKSDMVQGGRPKGGGLATSAQGKPKKGRTGQREVKKIKLSSDLDPDEDDDVDMR